MLSLYQTKSLCHFYKSTSGLAIGAGCTKAFLDTQHGDVSKVCAANGGPVFTGNASVTNGIAGEDQIAMMIQATGLGPKACSGLCMLLNGTLLEIAEVSQDTVTVLDGWLQEQLPLEVQLDSQSGRSIVGVEDPSIFTVGSLAFVRHYGGQFIGSFNVVAVDTSTGSSITLQDDGAVYDYFYESGTPAIAPAVVANQSIIVGGAYNDFQTVLNSISAYYEDQWIFFNEDLSPANPYQLLDSHDGETQNNTHLYIVGYNTYAYDCLPSGYGYFPKGTLNTATHYKTALQRARNMSDAALMADLPTVSSLTLTNEWMNCFFSQLNSENVQIMGIHFQLSAYRKAVGCDNETTGCVFLKHCSIGFSGYDDSPQVYGALVLSVGDSAAGGGIYDCFAKGIGFIDGTPPTVDRTGGWEIAYNAGIHNTSISPEYSGTIVHHNTFVWPNWAAALVTRGYINVFSNIFYLCNMGGFNLSGPEGRLIAWNNIIVLNEESPTIRGLFYIGNGGTVEFFDYNLCCNQNGQPVTTFTICLNPALAPDFNYETLKKGEHDIEKDPLFVDPANWDFRLRAASPCIGAGRPDNDGHPSDIGLNPDHKIQSLYGKDVSLFGS